MAADQRRGVDTNFLQLPVAKSVLNNPEQSGGITPLHSELFKPTLAEWNGGNQKLRPSKRVHEKDFQVPSRVPQLTDTAQLSRVQYFFDNSLHGELTGDAAKDILTYTKSQGGKVWISTAITQVYPVKVLDIEDGPDEHSQCVDILTRITVTRVPSINPFGLIKLVDFWQDIQSYQCHTDGDED